MCCTTADGSAKKPCFVMWMPSSLGTWSSTITRPMPALKPVKHRRRNEVGDEAQPQQARQQQHRADQQGQRRRRRDELRRIAVGHRQAELRCRRGSLTWWWS